MRGAGHRGGYVGGAERLLRQRHFELSGKLSCGEAIAHPESEYELGRVVESQSTLSDNLLERSQIGGFENQAGATPGPPRCTYRGRGDTLQGHNNFLHRVELSIGAYLTTHPVRFARYAPLYDEAVAIDAHKAMYRLGRRRNLPFSDHILGSTQQERKRGEASHVAVTSIAR